MTAGIPILDYADLRRAPARARFIRALVESLETYGFVAIENHEISVELLDRAYAVLQETFALPDPIKRQYEVPQIGRQRGYTAFGVEHARDQQSPDLKEFWHVGRELAPDHPLHRSGEVPHNRDPVEVPAFTPTFSRLFRELDALASSLLRCVEVHLELAPGFFQELTRDGNSVLRLIHYPPLAEDRPPGSVRAAAHEDINLLTVLPVSTEPGLEILTRDGRWLEVSPPAGVMVCDTGDMMKLLTGGRLPATTHRVVNPKGPNTARYSMPFFCHPHPDRILRPITGTGEGITARDFLHRRLRENGVA